MACRPQPAPFRTVQKISIQRQRLQCQDMEQAIQQTMKEYRRAQEQITLKLRQTKKAVDFQKRQEKELRVYQRRQTSEEINFQRHQIREKATFRRRLDRKQATPQQQIDDFEKLQAWELAGFLQELKLKQKVFQQNQASEKAAFQQKQTWEQNSLQKHQKIHKWRQATELVDGGNPAMRLVQTLDCLPHQDDAKELDTMPKQEHYVGTDVQRKKHSKQYMAVKRRAADVQLPPQRLPPLLQRRTHAHPAGMEAIGGTSSTGGEIDRDRGLEEVEEQTAGTFTAMDCSTTAASDHNLTRPPSHTM